MCKKNHLRDNTGVEVIKNERDQFEILRLMNHD